MKADSQHLRNGRTLLAPRGIPLNAPLKYRSPGTSWLEGETINISDTGVLFYCEEPLPPGTQVEVYLVLKTQDGEELPPLTVAVGEVVREEPPRVYSLPSMAVVFHNRQTPQFVAWDVSYS